MERFKCECGGEEFEKVNFLTIHRVPLLGFSNKNGLRCKGCRHFFGYDEEVNISLVFPGRALQKRKDGTIRKTGKIICWLMPGKGEDKEEYPIQVQGGSLIDLAKINDGEVVEEREITEDFYIE